ncbi:MAG TPA: hypothetical protein VF525_06845 [Pyrinomonadaceae bacterium]|jgi:hypothetical protein
MAFKFMLSFLSLVLLLGGLVLLATAQEKSRSAWTWQNSDDAWRREVRVEGHAEFNEDYTDVQSLAADSMVKIEERRGGETRRYEVRRGADDALRRTYWLNGAQRPLDAEAQRWAAGILLVAVRQGGLDARTRVARLLRQRGPDGVLAEIGQIEGDYGRRIYFDELLKTANLNSAALQKALREAARGIRSDYERAQLISHVADIYLHTDSLVPVFFETLDRIASDYERRRVMVSILQRPLTTPAVRRRLLQSAAALTSDYEKATLLIIAAPSYQADDALRAAFNETINTIGSDYERGRVRNVLARRTTMN